MKYFRLLAFLLLLPATLSPSYAYQKKSVIPDTRFITYIADPAKQTIRCYLKDEKGSNFGSLQNLAVWLKTRKRQLLFAMNGGMYQENRMPLGLYIEAGKTVTPLNTRTGEGNFYLSPNGVFYLTSNKKAFVCRSSEFRENSTITYATQSGPMLVTNGAIHTLFKKGSSNLNIRNGVGILPDHRVVFVMSKEAISLYDFAAYFLQLGCKNALYLDGFVSRTYAPSLQWVQTDGNFGVIIGVY